MNHLKLALLAVAVVACNKSDPRYCENAPLHTCDVDVDAPKGSADAAPMGCTAPGDCTTAGALVCDTDRGICVACIAQDNVAACTGASPVCGADEACHACVAHADCPSSACLPDGSCGTDTNVAYVEPGGDDNGTCTHAAPCSTVAKALAQDRAFVKIHGTIDNQQVAIDSQTVTLLADPGAELTESTTTGTLLAVTGTSQVTVYDLDISTSLGTGNPGISLAGTGATKLTLQHVTIEHNAGAGVLMTGGSLVVTRSMIRDNHGGGLAITGTSTFDITNNFITRNGTSSSSVGGALLTPSATSRFEFNTVVDNAVKNSLTFAGGVTCDDETFAAPNNLLVRNFVNNDATKANANTVGLCTFPTTAIGASIAGFGFAFPDDDHPYDYHIAAGSTAIGQATTASTVTVDYDGDARDAAPDQGADEVR